MPGACVAVRVDKPSQRWIVISALQVIPSGLCRGLLSEMAVEVMFRLIQKAAFEDGIGVMKRVKSSPL